MKAVKKWQRMSRYSRGSVREVHNSFSMHSANAKNFPNKWHRSGRIISLPDWPRLGPGLAPAWLPLFNCPFDERWANSLPVLHALLLLLLLFLLLLLLRAVILCRTHKLHKQWERERAGGRDGSGCYRPLHMCALFTDHLRRAVGVTNLLLKCGSILRLICH